MPRGKAVATRSDSTAALIQQRLERNRNRIKVNTGNKIKLDRRTLTFGVDGKNLDTMGGVIVEFAYFNRYDLRPYKEGDPTPPDCFAVGADEESMAPDPSCPAPQAIKCMDCDKNKWDSSLGRKVCRNKMRLAILPVGMPEAPIQILEVPPTSLRSLQIELKQILDVDQDVAAFTYEFEMDKKSDYPRFTTTCTGDNPDFEAMLNRIQDATSALSVQYDYSDAPTKPRRGAPRKSTRTKA